MPKISPAILLLALWVVANSQQKPKTPPQGCTVRNYQDHVRSEVRGMKEGEIREPCPVPKKAPAKKKPHTPAGQGGKNA
jgi:hypothetical protein